MEKRERERGAVSDADRETQLDAIYTVMNWTRGKRSTGGGSCLHIYMCDGLSEADGETRGSLYWLDAVWLFVGKSVVFFFIDFVERENFCDNLSYNTISLFIFGGDFFVALAWWNNFCVIARRKFKSSIAKKCIFHIYIWKYMKFLRAYIIRVYI